MEVNGTTYKDSTPQAVIKVLEDARMSQTRIIVAYGDAITGRDWNERYDISGRVGRSTGPVKVSLLLHNRRSLGGAAILDNCIVKIVTAIGKRVLYQHPTYHQV